MAKVFRLTTAGGKLLLASRIAAGNAGRATFGTYTGNVSKSKVLWATFGAAAASGIGLMYALERSVSASGIELHAQQLPWSHAGVLDSLDYASVRRGYQVYKQVCAACHSMDQIFFRHFTNVFMTEQEAMDEAAEFEIADIDQDTGKPIMRPRKLFDKLPRPYDNDIQAKVANNNALPPDLSWINRARHGNENYIFYLLTSYCDPPEGITLGEGQAYNPYFAGGVISMAQQLFDDMLEYKDGTPATQSQMAKDVATFLTWVAEPEQDTRKRMFLKAAVLFPLIFGVVLYYKRYFWTTIKSERFIFRTIRGREPPKPPTSQLG